MAALQAELDQRSKTDDVTQLEAARLAQETAQHQQAIETQAQHLRNTHQQELHTLKDKLNALEEVRVSYAKQIEQTEANNSAMHAELADTQNKRDQALQQAITINQERDQINANYQDLQKQNQGLDKQIVELTDEKTSLLERIEVEKSRADLLEGTSAKVKKVIVELRNELSELTSVKDRLTRDLSSISSSKAELAAGLEKQSAECAELQGQLAEAGARLSNAAAVSAGQENDLREQVLLLTAQLKKESEERPADKARIDELLQQLEQKEEDVVHRLADSRSCAEREYQQQVKSLAAEYDSRVTETTSAAAAVSATAAELSRETSSALEAALVVAQEESHDRANAYDTLLHTHAADAKAHEQLVKGLEADHASQQQQQQQLYQDKLNEASSSQARSESAVRSEAEALVKQVEAAWQARADKLLRQKEEQLKKEIDGLQQEWNRERKSTAAVTATDDTTSADKDEELERLTGVAAAAFRSGTDSVELLRQQVQLQRDELQHIKHQHEVEVRELKTLLDVKQQRRRRQGDAASMRLAGALEDAAEFEYLKNVLYQYMMGKETQTLAKVLCAVVKFDQDQQQEIVSYQQQQQQHHSSGTVQQSVDAALASATEPASEQ